MALNSHKSQSLHVDGKHVLTFAHHGSFPIFTIYIYSQARGEMYLVRVMRVLAHMNDSRVTDTDRSPPPHVGLPIRGHVCVTICGYVCVAICV